LQLCAGLIRSTHVKPRAGTSREAFSFEQGNGRLGDCATIQKRGHPRYE
jgi:hypothetical protein